jgi:DNA-binding CsgD family transcriptional regulator
MAAKLSLAARDPAVAHTVMTHRPAPGRDSYGTLVRVEGEWPLVGRAAELERVSVLLRGGAGGVVLAGSAGVGKTRLASECLSLAEERGFVPLRVAATQAASSMPFGAYAAFVPDLAGGSDRADVLRLVATAVMAEGRGKRVVLLVDDAHLLDEGSAALTHQLAGRKETFVLVTVRSGEPASDAVVALWKDGLAGRVELSPLLVDQVGELLTAVLGAPADGATVQVLFERTGGNVLFLKELVLGALDAGALRSDGGLWRLHGQLPPSARLVELVERRLARLAETDRNALEVLALGEPLGVDVIGETNVEGLERQGLLRIEEDGRRLHVRLAHPLYGDVLRARLSPLRLRRLSQTLADAVEARGARRAADVLRVATWQLQAGTAVGSKRLLAGAHQAYARHDLALAERLARAARDAGGGFDAGLLLGLILAKAGRGRASEAQLAALVPEAVTDRQRAALANTRILYLTGYRPSQAIQVANEAEEAIADPAARAEVTAWRTFLLANCGHIAEARDLAESVVDCATGLGLVMACGVVAWTLGQAGRVSDALAAADRGLAAYQALAGHPFPFAPEMHLWWRSEALALAGYSARAEELADRGYRAAVADGSVEGQAFASWSLGIALLAQGRVDSAARWARLAADLFLQQGNVGSAGGALLSAAIAGAMTSRAGEASDILSQYDALPVQNPLFVVHSMLARAWASAAGGDLSKAAELFIEASEQARAQDSFAVESSVLHDLARTGHATRVAPRLAELAELLEGPLAPARAAHAAALAAGDPVALAAASAVFEEMNAFLLSAEAAADAVVAWRKAGDPRSAAAAERRARALVDRCEGPRTPALTAISVRVALTARELEIARLAAAGVSNKEIAARLFLSLHTVQNKLHAAYEKLGVDGRGELAAALDGY